MPSTGFGFHSTAEEVTAGLDLRGQTWLVTGVNSGLGQESARVLALRGARIVGLARTRQKADAAMAALGIDGLPVACELSDLHSVAAAVGTVRDEAPLDGILANAGIMALPTLQQVHGIERQLFTNHLGHFALVTPLLDRLTAAARVVVLTSSAHRRAVHGLELDNASGERDYEPWRMYGRSKMANVVFARGLTQRFAGTARTANAVHPGVIDTNLNRHVPDKHALYARLNRTLKSVPQGAATQCWAAVHPALSGVSGPSDTRRSGGSDDIGDISWTVPTITLRFPSNIPGLPGHHWSNGVAMATPIAHKGAVAGARVMARTTLELFLRPQLVDQAWDYFVDEQGASHTYTPFIDADDPAPIDLNTEIMRLYKPLLEPFYYDETRYDTYLEQLGITYPTVRSSGEGGGG